MKYEYFWQRVADFVPTRRRLNQLQEVFAMLEEDYERDMLDLKTRVDTLERTVNRLHMQIRALEAKQSK